ncbi:hypothetical protein [Salibaculum halophilum]|uniref:hypothetical protein n=1 Tax=Salibaculum halophilum TaxID=1914408 RepID=UPI000A120BBC|nr:hypothetical protein [Salibaculum halophilum]
MRLPWLRLLLVLCAGPGFAQDVAIRSGEHESFSRLVLSIGEGTRWQLEKSGARARLRLSDPATEFDTSGIFERLPRQRLDAVTDEGGGVLSLRLACDPCHVDPFLWRPGRLVIDIVEGPDPAARDRSALATSPIRLPLARDASETGRAFLLPGAFSARPDAPGSNADPRVASMAREVARAVSAGYLRTSVESPTDPTTEAPPGDEEPPETTDPSRSARTPPYVSGGVSPGLSVGNALDRELAALNAALAAAADQTCLPPEVFDVAGWADDSGFSQQIARLRRGLVTEFDRPSQPAILRLARGYVHFGFGREALATLERGRAADRARAALAEMARLVDRLPGTFPVLSSQADCDNGAAPWTLLSGTVPLQELDRNGVIRAFRLLPQPLQAHLAIPMAGVFLEAGDVDGAALVFESVRGQDAARNPAAARMRAALLEAGGDIGAALGVLDGAAAGRTEPESLIRLLDLTLETGAKVQREDMTLADALMHENAGTETELRLASSTLRAHVARAEWDEARALLARYADRWPAAERAKLSVALFQALADSAAAPAFLETVFDDVPPDLDAGTVNTLAARLLDQRFPEKAIDLMDRPAAAEAMAERRYLRAQAALQLGRNEAVLQHLGGMTDDRAAALRAKALFAMGDERKALAALPGPPDAEADFRAGAWDRLAASDDPLLRRVADQALTRPDMTIMEGLAARRAALERARETRQTINDLLGRFPAYTEDDPAR